MYWNKIETTFITTNKPYVRDDEDMMMMHDGNAIKSDIDSDQGPK